VATTGLQDLCSPLGVICFGEFRRSIHHILRWIIICLARIGTAFPIHRTGQGFLNASIAASKTVEAALRSSM
jgi:hypothetical protein